MTTVTVVIPTWDRTTYKAPGPFMARKGKIIYERREQGGEITFHATNRTVRTGVIHHLLEEVVGPDNEQFSLISDGAEQYWVKTQDVQ